MKENNYKVFVLTNQVTGKQYVGYTSMTIEQRWAQGFSNQPKINNDIKLYGRENFTMEVIYSGLNKQDALVLRGQVIESNSENYNGISPSFDENGNREKVTYYQKVQPSQIVYCVELDQYFKTPMEAGRQTGVDQSSINKCCKGLRKSAGKHPETGKKLHWKFVPNVFLGQED